ncbi:hypothetical protein GSI_13453 [Ganoderma sinense ZZ0214-1]|uniref:Uncharacterized protein n=1 Tax=Ganoderma sinense ZZ0214-1 TaxID=1077348 RepID=A0A2G8RQB7_9APHY|nr:hypothetical protein GSI_13453 [Ganoderma sinense ZZ0214-1]
MPVIPTHHIPLRTSDLNLDISGVAGFFGGDVAVSAMGTVNIYRGRKWLGWYNMPGSYEIAKRYGRLARSRIWSGLYPGRGGDPAVLFELDGSEGPRYRGVYSGTIMAKTGHIAQLVVSESKELPEEKWEEPKDARKTSPVPVTIINLHHVPEEEALLQQLMASGPSTATSMLSLIPMLASAGACIACALVDDWLCFAMIALGMFCGGFSCLIIGSGIFTFTHPVPAKGAPRGDGILDSNNQMVILRGEESAINPITRGKFSLTYKIWSAYHMIGLSSFFLTVQFLVQLLVVPQGTIFGQIMFLSSLGVSWLYNSFLSSLDKEQIQRNILFKEILARPKAYKYVLKTWTAMAVFVLLVLATPTEGARRCDDVRTDESPSGSEPTLVEPTPLKDLLNDLLPNDTKAWTTWKEHILNQIKEHIKDPDTLSFDALPKDITPEMGFFLEAFQKDAQTALVAYRAYLSRLKEAAPNIRKEAEENTFEEDTEEKSELV